MNPFGIFGIGDIMRKFVISRIFHDPEEAETSSDNELQT